MKSDICKTMAYYNHIHQAEHKKMERFFLRFVFEMWTAFSAATTMQHIKNAKRHQIKYHRNLDAIRFINLYEAARFENFCWLIILCKQPQKWMRIYIFFLPYVCVCVCLEFHLSVSVCVCSCKCARESMALGMVSVIEWASECVRCLCSKCH